MEKFPQNNAEIEGSEPIDQSAEANLDNTSGKINSDGTLRKLGKVARIAGALGLGYLGMTAPEAEAKEEVGTRKWAEDAKSLKSLEHPPFFSSIKSFKLPKGFIDKEVVVPQNPDVKLYFKPGTPQSVIDAEIAKIPAKNQSQDIHGEPAQKN